jgi:hypothetical protein
MARRGIIVDFFQKQSHKKAKTKCCTETCRKSDSAGWNMSVSQLVAEVFAIKQSVMGVRKGLPGEGWGRHNARQEFGWSERGGRTE